MPVGQMSDLGKTDHPQALLSWVESKNDVTDRRPRATQTLKATDQHR
jgi:hypothetical protein